MSTINKILIGVLAVQVGLFALVRTRSSKPTIAKAKPLLPKMAAESVTRVQIFGSSTKGVDAKPDIDLRKKDGRWVLASHHDYPAKGDAVTELIGKIAAMQSRGPITTSKSRHEQLHVAANEYEGKLVIERSGGEKAVIYIGTSPKFRKLSVRLEGSDEIHGVSELTAEDAETSLVAWADNVYVEHDPARIVALTVENSSGTVSLEKGADGAWSVSTGAPKTAPAVVELDQQKVKNLVNKVERIELDKIAAAKAAPSHGFEKPAARITVGLESKGTKDGPAPQREVSIIEVGATNGGNYYLRSLDRSHVIEVGTASFSDFVELTADKLRKVEPKPESTTKPKPAAPGPRPILAPKPRPAPAPRAPAPRPAPAPKPKTP